MIDNKLEFEDELESLEQESLEDLQEEELKDFDHRFDTFSKAKENDGTYNLDEIYYDSDN